MEHGARLVRIRQDAPSPSGNTRALETYLQQAVARLWRVAHFVLVDFLGLRGSAGDAVRLDGGEPSDDSDDDEEEEYEKKTRGDGAGRGRAGRRRRGGRRFESTRRARVVVPFESTTRAAPPRRFCCDTFQISRRAARACPSRRTALSRRATATDDML